MRGSELAYQKQPSYAERQLRYEYFYPLPPLHHDGAGVFHLGMLVAADLQLPPESRLLGCAAAGSVGLNYPKAALVSLF